MIRSPNKATIIGKIEKTFLKLFSKFEKKLLNIKFVSNDSNNCEAELRINK